MQEFLQNHIFAEDHEEMQEPIEVLAQQLNIFWYASSGLDIYPLALFATKSRK